MMIAKLWPGDSPNRRVQQDDWLSMDLPPHSFAAAIGDGSLNSVSYPAGQLRIYEQLGKFVAPGGTLVFRVYLTPDEGEKIADLVRLCTTQVECSFQVFKWRLMMAMVAQAGNPDLLISKVWMQFQQLFPDRDRMSRVTGWTLHDIDSIDVYRGSSEIYNFPTRAQLLDAIPVRWSRELKPIDGYELAERCPLLVMRLPGAS
ncbi:MAG: hypothetical protein ABIN69_15115 [Aestuariivirga sp.]